MDYEFNVFYYIDLYKKRWKTVVLIVTLSMFLSMCFSLLKPPTYVSRVTLLLSGSGSSSSALGRFLGIPNLSVGNSSDDLITAILKSRRMANDINNEFGSIRRENPKFWWRIDTFKIPAGMGVEVEGCDSALTEKIANFAIQNLDKVNSELNITPDKPMVKVLDPATHGFKKSKQIKRKMLAAGIFSFFLLSAYIFFSDYLRKLKERRI